MILCSKYSENKETRGEEQNPLKSTLLKYYEKSLKH